ncbi:MAG TPA: hypothetical protein VF613_09010 [Longimicrobium sp.]|jgi:hypothetical protein
MDEQKPDTPLTSPAIAECVEDEVLEWYRTKRTLYHTRGAHA